MKTVDQYDAIINFLGDDITGQQSVKLMDEIKGNLSRTEIEYLRATCETKFYCELSQYNAEIGGLMTF